MKKIMKRRDNDVLGYVLEPRVMLDAAAVATGVEAVSDAEAQEKAGELLAREAVTGKVAEVAQTESIEKLLEAVSASTETQGKAVVVIDALVEDKETLINGIAKGTEIFVLDTQTDGLAQIADIIASTGQVQSLHIISHGDAGVLSLAEEQVNFAALSQSQQASLASMQNSLLSSADIFIYGCDFGAGERGKQAVEALASLTKADVAASDDKTGSVKLGADWTLERQSGDIESEIVLSANAQESFAVTLAEANYTNSDGNATYSAGTLAGSDKWIKKPAVAEGSNTFIDTKGQVKFVQDGAGTFGVSFSLVDDDHGDAGNTSSEMILGFTAKGEAQPGSTDYALGTTSVDFGIYYDSGIAYAFVNGDLTDLVMLGEEDAEYKIEVDETTGVVSFYVKASGDPTFTLMAESSGAGDFAADYLAVAGDYVLDMDIYGAGDGFDNIVMINPILEASGTFSPDGADGTTKEAIASNSPKGMHYGDLNNDGFEDIVVAEQDGYIAIYMNNGDGTLTRDTTNSYDFSAGTEHSKHYKDVFVADMNGDGDLDIVGVTYGGNGEQASMVIGINDGTGSYTWNDFNFSYTGTNYIERVNSVAVGNFDGSGDDSLDIAVTDGKGKNIVVFMNVMSAADVVTIAGVTGATGTVKDITSYTTNTNVVSTTNKPYVLETIEGDGADAQDHILVGTRPVPTHLGGTGTGTVFIMDSSAKIGSDWVSDTGGHVVDLAITQDDSGYGYVTALSITPGDTDNRIYVWRIDGFTGGVPDTSVYTDTAYIATTITKPRAVGFTNIDGDDDVDLIVASRDSIHAPLSYLNGDATGQDIFYLSDEATLDTASNPIGAADIINVNIYGTPQGTVDLEGTVESSTSTTSFFSGSSTNSIDFIRTVFDETSFYDTYSIADGAAQGIVAIDADYGDYAGALSIDLSGIEAGDVLEFNGGAGIDLNAASGTFGVYSYTIISGRLVVSLTSGVDLTNAEMETLIEGLKFKATGTTGSRVFEFMNAGPSPFAETRIDVVA